ncbi:sulfurtransferase [Geomonas subterranea]|uniref:sulfurtransferase n=1 Tax=Geomonas subterranea TaxID=2847989 RepID=UPI001CD2B345|nr:rhodanese-like domain-containing protein [Geomonas fuzhouensis]
MSDKVLLTMNVRRLSRLLPLVLLALALFVSAAGARAADLGLIDAAALKGAAGKWVILDARPRGEWLAGHIPGAISFCWEDYTRTDSKGVKYSSFPANELAALLGAQGIGDRTALVIYGDADKSWGGEGYDAWLFSWLGHRGPVRLLNGGIQAWRSAGFPLVQGAEPRQVRRVPYQAQPKPQTAVSTEELQNRKDGYTLVDVRSTLEWLKGRIPGAVHISWEDFYTGKERRPLSGGELRKLLAKHGVDLGKPVVYYCLGGVRSGYAWTVHQLAGLPEARNYKGGWEAWDKREGR